MDDKTYNAECAEKRARAERTLNEVIDELPSKCPLLPEHLEIVRNNTRIELACEEVPQLEEVINLLGQHPSRFLAGEEKPSLNFCKTKLSWFTDKDFAYWHSGRAIIIGIVGEIFPDGAYKCAMVAEVAHAIVDSAGPYHEGEFNPDPGVGEFYDYSLTLLYDSDAKVSKKLKTSELASLYKTYSGRTSSLEEAARKAAPEVLSVLFPGRPPPPEEELESSTKLAFDCFSIFETNPDHTDCDIIAWELLRAVSQHLGCSYEGAIRCLPGIACRALYDNSVDLSDGGRFTETVKSRLPIYLSTKTS